MTDPVATEAQRREAIRDALHAARIARAEADLCADRILALVSWPTGQLCVDRAMAVLDAIAFASDPDTKAPSIDAILEAAGIAGADIGATS